MSDYIEIMVIVEGKTEEIFINNVLKPYLSPKNIYMYPTQITKPGQKGGDIKFARAKNDIEKHLKQRTDTYLTLFVDYYGIKKDWPGISNAKLTSDPKEKSARVNQATMQKVEELFSQFNPSRRFIPYIAMHEFEALLFSDPQILAEQLRVPQAKIDKILTECGEPENIDDSPNTAPSKRLEILYNRFKKTSTGIVIAKAIGLNKIREHCPIFNNWLTSLENLAHRDANG